MTYEKFAESMTARDSTLTRKNIRVFAIKYALLLFLSALPIATLISSILSTVFSVIFLVLFLFLYIWSFDILVDNPDYFVKLNKVVKFWWLFVIIIFISCILINIFIL